mmetsp:Transcript_24277/g.55683  ORF Transcript_24277/g.55683 Transcript_24277/m.55683 type:complete len:235 (-) Transcript_24277:69-773(-)
MSVWPCYLQTSLLLPRCSLSTFSITWISRSKASFSVCFLAEIICFFISAMCSLNSSSEMWSGSNVGSLTWFRLGRPILAAKPPPFLPFTLARSSAVPMYSSSSAKSMYSCWTSDKTHAKEQTPVNSTIRHKRSSKYEMGFPKNEIGKVEAINCHTVEATMVVIMAPKIPVSKKPWTPSETPKRFSSPSSSLTVVIRAMPKKQQATKSWRPIKKPGKPLPSFPNSKSHTRAAQAF